MSDLAQVYQVVQLGPEVTAGGTVGATRQLRSMMITPAPQGNIAAMKAAGYKWTTLTQYNQEWSQFQMRSDAVSPNELIYPLSGVVSAGSVATAGTAAGGTAYTWTFNTNSASADTFKTYTVEAGDSNRAQNYPGVIFTDLTLTVDRTQATLSGTAIGQRMNDGITLSGTATLINQSIMSPGNWNIYIENSQAALGTATALSRAFQAVFTISGRSVPIWPVNSSNTSYAATVESINAAGQMQLTLQADATNMVYLTTMRNSARKFIRLKATGGTTVAGTAANYGITIDFSGEVIQMPNEQVMQELKMMQWTFGAVHDGTWGQAMQVVVTNDMSGY